MFFKRCFTGPASLRTCDHFFVCPDGVRQLIRNLRQPEGVNVWNGELRYDRRSKSCFILERPWTSPFAPEALGQMIDIEAMTRPRANASSRSKPRRCAATVAQSVEEEARLILTKCAISRGRMRSQRPRGIDPSLAVSDRMTAAATGLTNLPATAHALAFEKAARQSR